MDYNLRSYRRSLIFEESDIFPDDYIKKCKDNANEARSIPLEVLKTWNEWQWNKDCMHKWSSYIKSIWNSLQQIRIKMKLNSSSKIGLQDHSSGLVLTLIGLK